MFFPQWIQIIKKVEFSLNKSFKWRKLIDNKATYKQINTSLVENVCLKFFWKIFYTKPDLIGDLHAVN